MIAQALRALSAVGTVDREAASDEALALAARGGDSDAFAALVRRYQQGVVNLAYRLVGNWDEALDLSQEIFLRVYENLHRFDPQRPFKPWLYRIATNYCYDYLRRKGRQEKGYTTVSLEKRASVLQEGDDPEAWALRGELRQAIEEVIAALPPRYRAAVVLRYLEGMSYQEIADVLEVPLGTVKTYIHRARELLRTALEERGIRP